jgi:hypothetical protein
VDIAGPLADGGLDRVVDQFDHRRVAAQVLDIGARRVRGRARGLGGFLEEFFQTGRRLVRADAVERVLDVFRKRRDDLNGGVGELANLIHQEKIRRLGDRHGQHTVHVKERQHLALGDEIARQHRDHVGIHERRRKLDERNAVRVGQSSRDLCLRAIAQLDEDFAQQATLALTLLDVEGFVHLGGGDQPALDQHVAHPQAFGCFGRLHQS